MKVLAKNSQRYIWKRRRRIKVYFFLKRPRIPLIKSPRDNKTNIEDKFTSIKLALNRIIRESKANNI